MPPDTHKAVTLKWKVEDYQLIEQLARRDGAQSVYAWLKNCIEREVARMNHGLASAWDELAGLEQGVTAVEAELKHEAQGLTAEVEQLRAALDVEKNLRFAAEKIAQAAVDEAAQAAQQVAPMAYEVCPTCRTAVDRELGTVDWSTSGGYTVGLVMGETGPVVAHTCAGLAQPADAAADPRLVGNAPQGANQPTFGPSPAPAPERYGDRGEPIASKHVDAPAGSPGNPLPVASDSPLSVQGVPLVVDHRGDRGVRPPAQLRDVDGNPIACPHKVAERRDEGTFCATCGAEMVSA